MAQDKSANGEAARPPMPVYELDSYEPVEFAMPHLEVGDEQVEERMAQIAEQYDFDFEPSKRQVVGPKDTIEMDIEVFRDGEPIKALTTQGALFAVGEGLMPIDFDRNVLGMKVGQTGEFDFLAPDFDSPDKPEERLFHAKVTVNHVMDKVELKLTDEWVARHLPMYRDLAAFREGTREALLKEAEQLVAQEKNARAVAALAERFHGRIDDFFYEEARANLLASFEQQARAQGMDLEDFIGKQGMDENQFSMMLMVQVRSMLVEGFSLDAWARHYGIEATEDDVKELAGLMAPEGRGAELLARVEKDPQEREAFELAARRYVANKDLTAKATIIQA